MNLSKELLDTNELFTKSEQYQCGVDAEKDNRYVMPPDKETSECTGKTKLSNRMMDIAIYIYTTFGNLNATVSQTHLSVDPTQFAIYIWTNSCCSLYHSFEI